MAVVVSYYGNVESDVALSEAINHAHLKDTSLVVVLASDTPLPSADGASEVQPFNRDAVEDRLWDALRGADMSVDVRRRTAGASMAETVLHTAEDVRADMIVLGLRPGGSRKTHIGPTAAQILLDAPCPVVTTTTHLRREN